MNQPANPPLTVGLIGFGNIGTGVVRTLAERADEIAARLPRPIAIKTLADLDTTTRRDAPYDPARLKPDASAVLDDPEIEVVIELIGGEEPARTFVERAIDAGKHVVTANKALLALHGGELLARARERGVALLFEAAVGGGIPIIRAMQQGLAANRFLCVQGILNGTCNYILTEMKERGLSYDDALAQAQAKGYAEPDPTYDVEGYDTAHKIAILASLAFGHDIRFGDVHVEGIRGIQPRDLDLAHELGYAIKLLGLARHDVETDAVDVRVHPTLVPLTAPLAQVHGVDNAVQVEGEPIGITMFQGPGAGAGATSSAVVSDLMALAADGGGFAAARDARLTIVPGRKRVRPLAQLETNYYVRFAMADRPGAMAAIGVALAEHNVSIESMIQHRHDETAARPATISIVTHRTREADLQAARAAIEDHDMSAGKAFVLRVEE